MSHKSTILIVDDEPVGRQLIDAILYKEGYNLEFAENGQEAFEKAKSLNPDLILMDVMMPEIDGFEVCEKLRADSEMSQVPIILVTALDDIDSRIRGLESGADDYISKPFDRLELLARVKIITRLNRYRKTEQSGENEIKKETDSADSLSNSGEKLNLELVNLIHDNTRLEQKLNQEHLECFIFSNRPEYTPMCIQGLFKIKNNDCLYNISWKKTELSTFLLALSMKSHLDNTISSHELTDIGNILNELQNVLKDRIKNSEELSKIREDDIPHISLELIDRENMVLYHAGTDNPTIVIKNGELFELCGNVSNFIDFSGDNITFHVQKFELTQGNMIYLIPGCLSSKDEEKKNQLKNILFNLHHEEMKQQKKLLLERLYESDDFDEYCKRLDIMGIHV